MATLIPKEKPNASPVSAIKLPVASDGTRDYFILLESFCMLLAIAVCERLLNEESKLADTPDGPLDNEKLPGSRKGPAFSI